MRWVLLSYRLPREPSTPRIAVWRRLRRLGAVQIGDGVAALPLDDRTREQFDWLANDVEEAGGGGGARAPPPSHKGGQPPPPRRAPRRGGAGARGERGVEGGS